MCEERDRGAATQRSAVKCGLITVWSLILAVHRARLPCQEDDADPGGGGRKTKFSRLAWGLEIWELLQCSVELLYEPELQVVKS